MKRIIRFLMLVLASAGAGACGGDALSRSARADADTASWTLEPPSVRVGESVQAGQELDRVYGGLLRGDGTLLIGNSGTSELRLYDARGQLRSTAGRRGAGPGEFGSINWMARLRGDSVVAFDLRNQRFSVWTPAGAFARSFTSLAPPGPVRPIGVFNDGSLLIAVEGRYDPRRGPGVVRDSMRVLRIDPSGAVLRTFGDFPGSEWLVYEHPASFGATRLPFGRSGHLAVAGDHFVYGSSESGQLAVYDPEGREVRRVRLELPRRSLPRNAVPAFLSEIDDGPERTALARFYEQQPPENAPAFDALHGDRDGNFWLRLSALPGADSVKWLVVTPGGQLVGSTRLHTSAHLLDVREKSLLLRESDVDGVQRVSVRRVVR